LCEQNTNLQWVFVVNTLVVSFIYIYFLLLEVFTNYVLDRAIRMEDKQLQIQ
jgi:hypothetical protein